MLEEQVREAILTELGRQGANPECRLSVNTEGERLRVSGEIDLDALVFVIVSSLAGGP